MSDRPPDRECRRARDEDFPALARLLELYQYELSDLWDQDLDARGEYGYDLEPHRAARRQFAHVLLLGGRYAGVALVAPALVTRTSGWWMEQFFVLKKHRRAGHGRALAQHVFTQHPGDWEIGQMPGNVAARAYWRRVVADLTGGAYDECEVTEGWWKGTVQRFHVAGAGTGSP